MDGREGSGPEEKDRAEVGRAEAVIQWQGSERVEAERSECNGYLEGRKRHVGESGHGPELITDAKFEDFKLHIEFNCAPKSNSGVYLRGRYEVQIEDDPEPEGPSMRTGGVYGFLAPSPEQPRKPGTWQSYDITLVGRVVTIVQNGQTIIDKQEIPGITGGALDSHEALPAPIYLQGSEAGHVAFRNITITENSAAGP